ncbi:putative Amino acid transporter family protein [Blattamonas nauphoetae]|uniref:Amino acid transporter family protein n=1 Tax=Blattamonas nauphoetae TaxID=2049346 RepID=A0ABQ9X9F9_9EUKA|nr:putative Amino acid transporter family protein [Blattamonas nauphoetae]
MIVKTDSYASINIAPEELPLVAYKEDTDPTNVNVIGELAAYGVLVNGCIGAGFFSIPKTFINSGLILAILLINMGLSIPVLIYLFSTSISSSPLHPNPSQTLEMLARARGMTYSKVHKVPHHHTHNQMTFAVYSFTDVGRVFFGRPGQAVIALIMAAYGIMSMWIYGSMFASTSANLIVRYFLGRWDKRECIMEADPSDVCQRTYNLVLIGFGIIAFFIECLGMKYLTKIQVFFTIYRFVAFGTIILSCIISLAFNGAYWLQDTKQIGPESNPWYQFRWNGFPALFSSCSVAFTVCYHLPTILSPMKPGKKHAAHVTIASLLTVLIIYMGTACLVTLALGNDVLQFVILNYSNYGAKGFKRWTDTDNPLVENWFSTIIKLVVMLFPIMNLLSSFPLVSTTMATNIIGLFPESIRARAPDLIFFGINLIMSLIPLFLSSFFPSLGLIVRFTGIVSIFVGIFIPTLFHSYSRRKTKPEHQTPYSGWWSRPWLAVIWLIYGAFYLTLVGGHYTLSGSKDGTRLTSENSASNRSSMLILRNTSISCQTMQIEQLHGHTATIDGSSSFVTVHCTICLHNDEAALLVSGTSQMIHTDIVVANPFRTAPLVFSRCGSGSFQLHEITLSDLVVAQQLS